MLDPGRSRKYALGGDTYARASLYCIEFLDNREHPPSKTGDPHFPKINRIDRAEDDDDVGVCTSVDRDGTWRLDPNSYQAIRCSPDIDREFGIMLGYLVYFLPLCEEYRPLIQRSRRYIFSSKRPAKYFPRRTRLACLRIEEYLKRVECNRPK